VREEAETMRRKNFETPTQQGNVATTYERKGITSEIIIPLLSCLLVGLGVATSLVIAQWGILAVDLQDALRFGGGVGLLIASLAVTWRFYKAVVWITEEATRRDWDKDGYVGEPPEPRIITVRANNHAPVTDKRERLHQELMDFVKGCEVDTSMRRWEPRLGRDKYLMFRTILMDAGHAAWVNEADKRQGWELLAPAEDVIATFN
jgi:hypothetical protein